ncbi:MAG: fimbrillin family protein, partial [Alistipes sp.]
MKTKQTLWWALGSALCISSALTSCVKEDPEIDINGNAPRKIELSGDIDQVYATRVNDAGFCDGDAVGIYIVDYNGSIADTLLDAGNRADNVKHTFNEAVYKWTPTQDIYWKDDKTHIDIYGYYPYSTPDNVQNYTFEVQKDQSTSAAYGKIGGYEASDFLWGKSKNNAPTDKVIKLAFRHKMASVRVSLAEGTGFKEGEWTAAEKNVMVLNTKRKALINLSTGVVSATGDVPPTGTIPSKNGGDYRAIVVPQEIAASTNLLSITIDGTPYLYKKTELFTYIASKQHNFTITVNKRESEGLEFVLTAESITAWENDPTSHDATAREYIVIDVATAGGLKDAIKAAGKEYAKVKNLKIEGTIDARDFYFMRDEMSALQALNLKEVKIAAYTVTSEYGEVGGFANHIPINAMKEAKYLIRLILPDKLTGIEYGAFRDCAYLVGSLIIPEGVTEIETGAFTNCKSMTGTLSLPSTLVRIGDNKSYGRGAFQNTNFSCELILPSSLTSIGTYTFSECKGLYGALNLPDGLTYIGNNAFRECIELTGSITIPKGVKQIEDYTFCMSYNNNGRFNGSLILHDDITAIGQGAFAYTGLRGELQLPKDLVVINDRTFRGCDFSGELKMPRTVAVIGAESFKDNWRLTGVLNIPQGVQSIGANAFENCRGIEGAIFSDGIETIARSAFNMCTGIGTIICKGSVPAHIQTGAFDGVPKDNFTVEVPEASIQQYQTAVGWSDFKRISAYRNLAIRPNVATAINSSVTRNLVLSADDVWTVESKPDWIALDKTSGKGKVELKMTFSEMTKGSAKREGEVVFKLRDKEYRTRCTVIQ